MRHQKRGRKLSRTASHRKAMLGNLATSLLKFNRVETGHAKALELRGVVDRLIGYAKRGDLHARRLAASTVKDSVVLQKLFTVIAPHYKDRKGGYTRILKTGYRSGDAASMAIIELVGLAQMEKEVGASSTIASTPNEAAETK